MTGITGTIQTFLFHLVLISRAPTLGSREIWKQFLKVLRSFVAWAEVSALSSNDKTVDASRKTNWGRCGVFKILAC